jgi:hypothetical protein
MPQHFAEQFSRKLEAQEWAALFHGVGKTDLIALIGNGTKADLTRLLRNPNTISGKIARLENEIQTLDSAAAADLIRKTKQLSTFMSTRVAGSNLLANAEAVAWLLNEPGHNRRATPAPELVQAIDQLASAYAFEQLSQEQKDLLTELARTETTGLEFLFTYFSALRVDEVRKAVTGTARFNYRKGDVPQEAAGGATMIVARTADHEDLTLRGYKLVEDYHGSSLDRYLDPMAYYLSPVAARASYAQGILQTVQPTAFGVNMRSGRAVGLSAGYITGKNVVDRIRRRTGQPERGTEPLIPVFNDTGEVIAYERSIDPVQWAKVERVEDFSRSLGMWRGRQLEEAEAQYANKVLVDRLHDAWVAGVKQGKEDLFVDVYSDAARKKDPVLQDAFEMIPDDVHDMIRAKFGGEFYIRRGQLDDVLGYRNPSVRDLWTGKTRWSPEIAKNAAQITSTVFGPDIYQYLVKTEEVIQGLVGEAKSIIVVKSVLVPAANFLNAMYQTIARGVPLNHIVRAVPKIISEVTTYIEARDKVDLLEAEILAADDGSRRKEILIQRKKDIEDTMSRLAIWPLIQNGEFTAITDGLEQSDLSDLVGGRLRKFVERQVDKLPDGVKNAGRYAYIARDTALFQGLQRSVQYGDFIAKAVLYQDLIGRQNVKRSEALGQVTEEFVHFDRLPGRFRGYVESIGLLWFWTFKLRSIKTGLAMLRDNPVHSLAAMVVPEPDMFGNLGLPFEENALGLAMQGDLGYSMGPGMGFQSFQLNPWLNVTT